MQGGYNRDGGSKSNAPKEKGGVYFPFLVGNLQKYAGEASDNVLRVKTVRVDKITLIGRVVGHKTEKNRWTLTINDSTGNLEVLIYKLPVVDRPPLLNEIAVEDGVYVKIICSMKFLEGHVYIVDHIEEIKDFNLITNHILCAVHALLSTDNDVKLDSPEATNPVVVVGGNSAMKEEFDHLEGKEKFVAMLKAQYEETKKEQLSVDDIKRRLAHKFSESDIKNYLKTLEDDGDMTVSNLSGNKYYEFTG